MLEYGHLDGIQETLTGKTLREELMKLDPSEYQKNLDALFAEEILKPFDTPYLDRGHLVYLQGNMGGGWTKVSNAGLEEFRGRAIVFENEQDFLANYQHRGIAAGSMVVIRNMGPK